MNIDRITGPQDIPGALPYLTNMTVSEGLNEDNELDETQWRVENILVSPGSRTQDLKLSVVPTDTSSDFITVLAPLGTRVQQGDFAIIDEKRDENGVVRVAGGAYVVDSAPRNVYIALKIVMKSR